MSFSSVQAVPRSVQAEAPPRSGEAKGTLRSGALPARGQPRSPCPALPRPESSETHPGEPSSESSARPSPPGSRGCAGMLLRPGDAPWGCHT